MKDKVKIQILENAPVLIALHDPEHNLLWANRAYREATGLDMEQLIGKKCWIALGLEGPCPNCPVDAAYKRGSTAEGEFSPANQPLWPESRGSWIVSATPLKDERGSVTGIIEAAFEISYYKALEVERIREERKAEEEKIRNQVQMLSWLYDASGRLTQALDVETIARQTVRLCVEAFGATLAWLGHAGEDGSVRVLTHYPEDISYPTEISVRWDETEEGQGPTGRAIREGKPQIYDDVYSDPSFAPWREKAAGAGIRSSVALPLITRNQVFGALNLYSNKSGHFTPDLIQYLQSFAHMAANALENARLFEEKNRRIQRIQALRNIDMAITGAFDLRIVYRVALEEIVTGLKVDAACILIHNPHDNSLEIVAERGFRRASVGTFLSARETIAGRALREQKIVHIPNLREVDRDEFTRRDFMLEQGFISYYGVPLVAKGKLLGVLEVFSRKLGNDNQEWLHYLETLGGQVAIAIENAALVDDMRLKHLDLLNAYDETIEGWGQALSLKEEETADHSERVTRMTVEIAKRMGIRGEDLIHVRRGALLHDIGKIGIPDSILLKPGKLTEEEWVIMRKHPVYAFEMLSPIAYLRQAIDIPYCHHERWDGTGYPRGLKGKQIPLAARIFAVVDVWDALSSDRPYRKAWPQKKVIEYIKELAGTHFDPEVVEEFVQVLQDEEIIQKVED